MVTITISKIEYSRLRRQADAYKKLSSRLFEFAIKDPVEDVVNDFRETNLYTKEFLVDLEDGLKKSSYAKNEIKTVKKGSRKISYCSQAQDKVG